MYKIICDDAVKRKRKVNKKQLHTQIHLNVRVVKVINNPLITDQNSMLELS